MFPCHTTATGGCSCHHPDCASPAKHPRVARGLHAATVDETLLHQWWARWPAANVAIRTGAPSGLVVVDIDPDHDGHHTLRQLVVEHGPLADGRIVTTGSGGQHLYFKHPGGIIRNDAGRRVGPGIDVRGDGGYVLAPPSRHRSGHDYTLASGGTTLPPLPDWLRAALEPPIPTSTLTPTRSAARRENFRGDAWANTALDGELQRLRSAQQGARNDTLNRVAYRLGQIIGAGLLREDDTRALLIDQAIAIGLGEREVNATTHSGLAAGLNNPARPSSDNHDVDDDLDIGLEP